MNPKKKFYSNPQQKPVVAPPHWDTIPVALRDTPRWVVWRLIPMTNADGSTRLAKMPSHPRGTPAKVDDPSTWVTFDEAKAAYLAGGSDGVGFVLGDDPAAANEAPDDPHRLARRFLVTLAPDGQPPRLRHWLGGWCAWENGRYRPLSDDDLRAKLVAYIPAEFVRSAAGGPDDKNGRRRVAARKVTNTLVANALAALKAICNVPVTVAPPPIPDGRNHHTHCPHHPQWSRAGTIPVDSKNVAR